MLHSYVIIPNEDSFAMQVDILRYNEINYPLYSPLPSITNL